MKTTLKVNLPEIDDLTGLLVAGVDARWRHSVVEAEQQAEGNRRDVESLFLDIEAFPRRIRLGQATQDTFEKAISRHRALTLLQPEFDAAIEDAKRHLDAAELQAREDALARVRQVRDALQRTADELTPVLRKINDVEYHLDGVVKGLELAGISEVEPVTWPMCVLHECNSRSAQARSVSESVELTAAERRHREDAARLVRFAAAVST